MKSTKPKILITIPFNVNVVNTKVRIKPIFNKLLLLTVL